MDSTEIWERKVIRDKIAHGSEFVMTWKSLAFFNVQNLNHEYSVHD